MSLQRHKTYEMGSSLIKPPRRAVQRSSALLVLESPRMSLTRVVRGEHERENHSIGASSIAPQRRFDHGRAASELALEGKILPHRRFLLRRLLYQLSPVEHEIVLLDERLEDISREQPALEQAVSRWDTIPGIDRVARWTLLSEVGPTMAQFPTAEQLASWASLAQVNRKVLANAGR